MIDPPVPGGLPPQPLPYGPNPVPPPDDPKSPSTLKVLLIIGAVAVIIAVICYGAAWVLGEIGAPGRGYPRPAESP